MKQIHVRLRIIAMLALVSSIVASSQTWQPLNGPSKAKNVRDLAVSASGQTLYAADESFLFKSPDWGSGWSVTGVSVSSPLTTTIKPGDATYVVVGGVNFLKYSSNGGTTWTNVSPTQTFVPLRLVTSLANQDYMLMGTEGVESGRSLYNKDLNTSSWSAIGAFTRYTDVTDIAPDPSNVDKFWVSGADPNGAAEATNPNPNNTSSYRGLWMTQDRGSTWNDKRLGDYNVTSVAFNGANVYAGTATGKFFYSNDNGNNNSWTQRTTPSNVDIIHRVHRIGSGTSILITTDEWVYKSTNEGESWTAMAVPDASDKDVKSLTIALNDVNKIYVGTAKTVYKTTDGGTNWSVVENGLGRMPIKSIDAYNGTVWTASTDYPLIGTLSYPGGWQLVSSPIIPGEYQTIPGLYSYRKGYHKEDTLKGGIGYWARPDTVLTISGFVQSIDSFKVEMGWNIIGSVNVPVPRSAIVTIPDSLILTDLFGFNGSGYVASDTVYPGRAYWVKTTHSGKIVLPCGK